MSSVAKTRNDLKCFVHTIGRLPCSSVHFPTTLLWYTLMQHSPLSVNAYFSEQLHQKNLCTLRPLLGSRLRTIAHSAEFSRLLPFRFDAGRFAVSPIQGLLPPLCLSLSLSLPLSLPPSLFLPLSPPLSHSFSLVSVLFDGSVVRPGFLPGGWLHGRADGWHGILSLH